MRYCSSDVYQHEMPGGQYTNLKFQAASLGLGESWGKVQQSYAAANRALGDIVKVGKRCTAGQELRYGCAACAFFMAACLCPVGVVVVVLLGVLSGVHRIAMQVLLRLDRFAHVFTVSFLMPAFYPVVRR